jgi:hypothetical protein
MQISPVTEPKAITPNELFDNIAQRAVAFFYNESHPDTGLTKDRAKNPGDVKDDYTVASIAATGYALSALCIGAERKWLSRRDAEDRALLTLRFIQDKLPAEHGFHYHFVDWRDGKRVWNCELSSIDSALLVKGVLAAGQYFGGECARRADAIYAGMDWQWMQNRKPGDATDTMLSMGWKPESGFLEGRWARYDEASYLYLLAMGAPRYPLPPSVWDRWEVGETTLEGFKILGRPGPLFFVQMTPAYFDLRGQKDRLGRDWWLNFENTHRANHRYCARNAAKFKTYSETIWGITACDQPPDKPGEGNGYGADEPVDGNNRGTVAPTAALAGILFVPEISKRTIVTLYTQYKDRIWGRYGFANAFNVDQNWYDTDVLGIDLGMMLLAIENSRSGLIWKLMRSHPAMQKGMRAAGFRA